MWLTKGIYRYFYIDIVEVSIYTNLIVLSAATLVITDSNKEIVTRVLVGIVFAAYSDRNHHISDSRLLLFEVISMAQDEVQGPKEAQH